MNDLINRIRAKKRNATDEEEESADRIEQLEAALRKCLDRFQYYVDHHNANGHYDKARGNEVFVDMIDEVLGEKL